MNISLSKLGLNKKTYQNVNKKHLLDIFNTMSYCREFEKNVIKYKDQGLIKILVYLSLGQESISAAISHVIKNPWVLFQHRGHSNYISFGGNQIKLIDELLGLDTGSNKGYGGSPPIQDFENKIIGHSGLIGDNVPIACGLSMKIKKNDCVICFFGDGAAEEDFVLSALGFAGSKKLPILFICEDNNLSVLTPKKERRSWEIYDVAKSFNINACDITDDPQLITNKVKLYKQQLPALINVRTCRDVWHEGTGNDGKPEWSRYKIFKKYLLKEFSTKINNIEKNNKTILDNLWKKRLQKL